MNKRLHGINGMAGIDTDFIEDQFIQGCFLNKSTNKIHKYSIFSVEEKRANR